MSEEARILLEKLQDARNVWVIVEGNMISLTQDEVHILMEEIDRLKNCNNSLIVIRDKYEVGIEEKDKEIEKLQDQLQQKENIIKELREKVENFDVFKEFTFLLMKKWEEQEVKSSIDYEWNQSIKKPILEILGKGE